MNRLYFASAITTTILTFVLSGSLYAQSFNPSVEVTNSYEGKLVEAQKIGVPMSVPDSLLKFNYRVDYQVFDHPYSGSYEFHPYLIEMKPDATIPSPGRFYLNAGAGYTLAPQVDIVYCGGKPTSKFTPSVYDSFRGYFGPMTDGQNGYDGYVLRNSLGFSGRIDAPKVKGSTDVCYQLSGSDDAQSTHLWHQGSVALELNSRRNAASKTNYHFGLGASFGHDAYRGLSADGGVGEMSVSAEFGVRAPYLHFPGNAFGADAEVEYLAHSGAAFSGLNALRVALIPRYTIDGERLHANIGIRLSMMPLSHRELSSAVYSHHYNTSTRFVYPDIRLEYQCFKDYLSLFLNFTGGDHLDKYSELLAVNPFYTLTGREGLDATITKADLNLGLRGVAFKHLEYRLSADYVAYGNYLNESYALVGSTLVPDWCYTTDDLDMLHADLSLAWRSRAVDLDLHARYQHVTRGTVVGLMPAALLGDASLNVHIGERLTVGAFVRGSAERKFSALTPPVKDPTTQSVSTFAVAPQTITTVDAPLIGTDIPMWVDLGVRAEYQCTSKFSIWCRAGNLLLQDIYDYAYRARKGINITAGICLNVR